MDVKEIIWHLQNFQNTWKGWDGLISGLTGFFSQFNDLEKVAEPFTKGAETISGLSSN